MKSKNRQWLIGFAIGFNTLQFLILKFGLSTEENFWSFLYTIPTLILLSSIIVWIIFNFLKITTNTTFERILWLLSTPIPLLIIFIFYMLLSQ